MMDPWINGESDRRAFWPGMRDHFTALLHRARLIRLADEDQGRRRQVRAWDAAAGVIDDRGAEPLGEILRAEIAIEGVERGAGAHRLAEHGNARRVDILQRRQIAPRRVGIKGLTKQPAAACAADAPRA